MNGNEPKIGGLYKFVGSEFCDRYVLYSTESLLVVQQLFKGNIILVLGVYNIGIYYGYVALHKDKLGWISGNEVKFNKAFVVV